MIKLASYLVLIIVVAVTIYFAVIASNYFSSPAQPSKSEHSIFSVIDSNDEQSADEFTPEEITEDYSE